MQIKQLQLKPLPFLVFLCNAFGGLETGSLYVKDLVSSTTSCQFGRFLLPETQIKLTFN